MPDITGIVHVVRESVAAILRIQPMRPETVKRGKVRPATFRASVVGTAFCVVENRYLITAYHVPNGGLSRNARDRFYAFIVPQNGSVAHPFPVVSFPIERADLDIAVLEVGPCSTAGVRIPAMPVSFVQQADGSRVVTIGFPAPEIGTLNVDPQGNYLGGQFFLKSHANEGMVSAQYIIGGVQMYELNVGWHHGESGGPVVSVSDPPGAFSLMQHYRNIKSPHGTVAGPHRGCALSVIQQELAALGVTGA